MSHVVEIGQDILRDREKIYMDICRHSCIHSTCALSKMRMRDVADSTMLTLLARLAMFCDLTDILLFSKD